MQRVNLGSISLKTDYGLTASAMNVDTGHKFLRITDIRHGRIVWDQVPFCECNPDDVKKYELRKGDVVFARTGSVGNSCLITDPPEGAVFASYLIRIRPDYERVDPRFLAYFFQTTDYWQQIECQAVGAIHQGLNASRLKQLTLPLPPLPEQQRIAGILSRADRLRRLRRYALEMSDGYLQSVFLEMFGGQLSNSSQIRFGDVLKQPLQNGVFLKNDRYGSGTPVIWVDNLYHTNSVDTSNLRRAALDEKAIVQYEVSYGDLLFTRSSLVREGIGQVTIVSSLSERTAFECHIIRARVDHKRVNPYFVFGLYRSEFGKAEILRRSNTATMTTIGQGAISELPCPLPPISHQDRYAELVCETERLRVRQQEALRQAEHLFQTLLHGAFRGEVDHECAK